MNDLDVIISKASYGHFVIFLSDMVGMNNSGKHRETISSVEGPIIVISVDSCQFL